MQNLEHKTITSGGVQPTGEDGVVEALVSVTGIKDNVGDIIIPGAYAKTLKTRKPKGAWSHEWQTPVSKVREIKELMPGDPNLPKTLSDGKPWPKDAGALYVKAEFNLNTNAGKDAYENVKFFGEDCEWSIGYRVPKGGATKDAKTGIRHIKDLNLYEFSPVLFGAASEARSLNSASIKSLQFELDGDDESDDDKTIEDEIVEKSEVDGEFEFKDGEPSDEELIDALLSVDEAKVEEFDLELKSEERSEPREIELNAVVIDQLKTLQDQISKVLDIALGISEAKEIEPVEIPTKSLDEAITDILDSETVEFDQKTLYVAMKLERTSDEEERKALAIDVLDRIDGALNSADADAELLLKTLAKAIGDSYEQESKEDSDHEEDDSSEKAVEDAESEVKTLTIPEAEYQDFLSLIGKA